MRPDEITSQKQLFRIVGIERGLYSEISGRQLKGEPSNFAHILRKGIFTKAKLDPDNIVLLTPEEHYLFDNDRSEILTNPKWKWLFHKEERLLKQYL